MSSRIQQFVPLQKIGTSITPKVSGDSIDSAAIGSVTPAAGGFTTLIASTDPVDTDGVGDRGYNDSRYETPTGSQSKVDTHTALTTGAHGVSSDYVTKTSKSSQVGEFAATVVVGRSGAVDYLCDGTADNVQIQAAIDYVGGIGGGSVHIREGTYLFSSKVTITGLSNIEIIGQKGSTIIKQDANITYGSFEIKGDSSNITIKGIIFDNANNTATSNAHCVVIGESEHVFISECVFKNVKYYVGENGSDGIYINARGTSPPSGTLIYDVTVQNCKFLDISRNGVSVIRGERIRVINNYFCVRRSGFDGETNNTDEKIESVIVNNNYFDGVRELEGVEESGTPETKAFSGNGASIEFNIVDANLSCDNVVINSNVCVGNGTNGNGLIVKKSLNVNISNNVWNNFKGASGREYSVSFGNVKGIFTNNTIENYGSYNGIQSYSDSEFQISDCLIKEGDGHGIDAQGVSIKDCTFIDCGDSTNIVIINDDTNTSLYIDGCTFAVDDKTNIAGVFDFFTSSDFNISAIINNISVVGSAYKSLIKGNANRGVKLVIKNSHFEDCGTLTDNFIHFYSYTGLDSILVLENNIFKDVLGDISARACKHIKINNNMFIDCGKEDQNYILAYECGDVQFQNNYLRDTRSSAKPLYFIQVDSVLGGWTNTTRVISNNQFIGTGFTSALRIMTSCTLYNNFFNNVSLAEGNFVAPTVPASTVNYTNAYGFTCQVSIYGGTVTAIDLDDVATGLTYGIFIIPPGETINITYSSVPTWKWWGL